MVVQQSGVLPFPAEPRSLVLGSRGCRSLRQNLIAGLCAAFALAGAHVRATGGSSTSLYDLSIEELMNESVTSVSKKETSLLESPAAVAIITQDEIRRMGITTIPEALRWVPGMEVGRIDSHTWAISARGFQREFADKLLVLVDGRAVYEPSFAGVLWEVQDVVLEDLDRIEVIRGPGATLWGANAVNGVVNIITKKAKDTQGTLVTGSIGTEDRPSTTIRHGGQLATNVHYRAYVKYYDREGLVTPNGHSAGDDWDAVRTGFRTDWEASETDLFTLQGDYYASQATGQTQHPMLSPPFTRTFRSRDDRDGGNILGRWTRSISDTSEFSVQSYYTHTEHELAGGIEYNDTFDLELQHRFAVGSRNDLMWGVGYRWMRDELPSSARFITWNPELRTMSLFTAFLQDEITLVPDQVRLTVGSKFEHNDPTGFEVQPGARLAWTPTAQQTVWGSVSRAVRTPSRTDRDARYDYAAFPAGTNVALVSLLGDDGVKAEELIAYELGYRIEPTPAVSLDLATFYNVYDDVIRYQPGDQTFEATPPPAHVLLPQYATNTEGGESYGAELAVQYKVTGWWRLAADYTWLHIHFLDDPGTSFDSPEHQVRMRSFVDLPGNVELMGAVSYVDQLRDLNVPSYVRLDLGVVWRPRPSLEVGIWGQNLLEDQHPEFPSSLSARRTEVPRSVLGRVTWRF